MRNDWYYNFLFLKKKLYVACSPGSATINFIVFFFFLGWLLAVAAAAARNCTSPKQPSQEASSVSRLLSVSIFFRPFAFWSWDFGLTYTIIYFFLLFLLLCLIINIINLFMAGIFWWYHKTILKFQCLNLYIKFWLSHDILQYYSYRIFGFNFS